MEKGIFKLILYFLAFTVLNAQDTSEADTFSNTIGNCIYSIDQQNRYTCHLHNAIISAPNQVLTITGTHLPGRTNVDVQVVVHQNVTINFFNGEILRTFPNLRIIEMENVRLTNIAATAFGTNCGHLEELKIRSNFLTTLPNQLFQNCSNLQVFQASQNGLFSLPNELFGNTISLRIFEVDRNQLTSFPTNLLTNMINLRTFNINRNMLSNLHATNFVNNGNLEEIDVSFNRLTRLFELIATQINLRRLRMNSNFDFQFNFALLVRFQNLQVLNVDANQGRELMNSLPISLTDLTINGISATLMGNPFRELRNLVHLSISGFGIRLDENTFHELTNLRTLSVTNTNIANLHSQQFSRLLNLRTLVLDSGRFLQLPDGIFANLSNLEILSMSFNEISVLHLEMFGHHPQLRTINFQQNFIHEIQRGIFERFNPTLLTANFNNNFCVNRNFENVANLDEHEGLQRCFENFDRANPSTTLGSGNIFKSIEVLGIFIIGSIVRLWSV